MRERNAGKTRDEMQADADDEQSHPRHELHMAVDLNEAVESRSERKIKTDDAGYVRANGKAEKQRRGQRHPDEVDVKFSVV